MGFIDPGRPNRKLTESFRQPHSRRNIPSVVGGRSTTSSTLKSEPSIKKSKRTLELSDSNTSSLPNKLIKRNLKDENDESQNASQNVYSFDQQSPSSPKAQPKPQLSILERLPLEILQYISILVGLEENNLLFANKYLYNQLNFNLDPDLLVESDHKRGEMIWPRSDYLLKMIRQNFGFQFNNNKKVKKLKKNFEKTASLLPKDYSIHSLTSFEKFFHYIGALDYRFIDIRILNYSFITPSLITFLISRKYRFINDVQAKKEVDERKRVIKQLEGKMVELNAIDYDNDTDTLNEGWESKSKINYFIDELADEIVLLQNHILYRRFPDDVYFFPENFINKASMYNPDNIMMILDIYRHQNIRIYDCKIPLYHSINNNDDVFFLFAYPLILNMSENDKIDSRNITSLLKRVNYLMKNPELDVPSEMDYPLNEVYPNGPKLTPPKDWKINKAWYFAIQKFLILFLARGDFDDTSMWECMKENNFSGLIIDQVMKLRHPPAHFM